MPVPFYSRFPYVQCAPCTRFEFELQCERNTKKWTHMYGAGAFPIHWSEKRSSCSPLTHCAVRMLYFISILRSYWEVYVQTQNACVCRANASFEYEWERLFRKLNYRCWRMVGIPVQCEQATERASTMHGARHRANDWVSAQQSVAQRF